MITIILPFLLSVAAVAAGTNETECSIYRSYEGVDPNTLSCDPLGQIFLLLPHFIDCTKFFMCAYGEEVEFHCSGGFIFDFELQMCNRDCAATCILRNPRYDVDPDGSGNDKYAMIGADEAQSGADTLTADSAGTVRPMAAGQSYNHLLNCHRADAAARQLPYKGDCQRYWKCVAGIPQAVYCTDGLFFNQQTQQCDYEANAKCSVQGEDELQGEFIVSK